MGDEYGTIKIPRSAFEEHNARRKELGLSWLQYIDQESVDVTNTEPGGDNVEMLADLLERLESIDSSTASVEERTGRIERTLEEMGGR